MIDQAAFHQLRHLREDEHWSVAQIATALPLDERTVRKGSAVEKQQPRKTGKRPSKRAPFKSTSVRLLARLMASEPQRRQQLALARRIAGARFPGVKTLDPFDWNWPKKSNRPQVQNRFRRAFLKDQTHRLFLGGVGLGKTHLASALGDEACLRGHTGLFTTAVDSLNPLTAAQTVGRLKNELQRYRTPTILVVDELGDLPIDKTGADLRFQGIRQRYEQGAIVLTTNQPQKPWPKIFNNDSPLTRAVWDR